MARRPSGLLGLLLLVVTLSAACGQPSDQGVPTADGPAAARATGPKQMHVVVSNEPAVLYYPLAPLSTRGSAGMVFWFLGAGVALGDREGVLHPLLVEQIPSIENGLWKLGPDGT